MPRYKEIGQYISIGGINLVYLILLQHLEGSLILSG